MRNDQAGMMEQWRIIQSMHGIVNIGSNVGGLRPSHKGPRGAHCGDKESSITSSARSWVRNQHVIRMLAHRPEVAAASGRDAGNGEGSWPKNT